jgi:GH15 family glucan-1,4-alpha-glucosidase
MTGASAPGSVRDHALIGDGRSAALVSPGGAIDWLCWPRFDSPSIFGEVVRPGAGTFRIAPTAPYRASHRYLDDSAVLETRFEVGSATLVVTDGMITDDGRAPARFASPEHELIRDVRCEGAPLEVEIHYEPRPAYGAIDTRGLVALGPLGFRLEHEGRLVCLRSDAKLIRTESGAVAARLFLRPGESRTFSLTYEETGPAVLPPLGDAARERLARTYSGWRLWAAGIRYAGPWRDALVRSAVTLALLTYRPTGALLSAPTLGLAEPGGPARDERVSTLRGAARTMRALLALSLDQEADAQGRWLVAAAELSRPALGATYDLRGRPVRGPGRALPTLAREGGAPPPAGGGDDGRRLASYGEVIDALGALTLARGRVDIVTARLIRRLGDWARAHWREPDPVGEVDDYVRRYTHSLAMSWLAMERLLELDARGLVRGMPVAMIAAERERMRDELAARAWREDLGAYSDSADDASLGASLLLLACHGFEPAEGARMKATVARVREGLGGPAGTLFLDEPRRERGAASPRAAFWLAEALARGAGTLDDAAETFNQALAHANDVGLFAAATDATGVPAGPFPHALTHAALVSAALAVDAREATLGRRHAQARAQYGE